MSLRPRILICDDDLDFSASLARALSASFELVPVANGDLALAALQAHAFSLLLLDVSLRTPTEGLDLLPRIRALDPDLPILMLTGHLDFGLVRRAMQLGAWDYLPKDRAPDELIHALTLAIEKAELVRRSRQKSFELASEQRRHPLVGSSAQTARLRSLIERVRPSHGNVLITGETGTGKEVVARQLRKQLPNGELEPFVAIDSSTIQSTMAESVLFGHQKGAFTGADQARKGVFEEAHGGVVYFDEIANMPLDIQAKLLRVVQEKEVMRLGSSRPISLEFRVICATNQDLERLSSEGRFKPDLFQRFNVLPIEIPPLRERPADIPDLFWHFLRAQSIERAQVELAPGFLEALQAYAWPGNARELANAVSYVLAMCDRTPSGEVRMALEALPPRVFKSSGPRASLAESEISATDSGTLDERLRRFEVQLLRAELTLAGGNVSQMAQKLAVDRSNLHKRLKGHGLL